MPAIVLSTLNARYAHASLALRYLFANLGTHQDSAVIREHVIHERPVDIVEALLKENPRIVGLGIYIWNAQASLEVVRILKQVAPDVLVVLGGPEVHHELDGQEIVLLADHVVTGEGEVSFRRLVDGVFAGETMPKVIPGEMPDVATLIRPYDLYTDHDVAHRVVYVEASRGCPFTCEFCLSSLDQRVRNFPLDAFLEDLDALYRRGLRQFKFIDRTFNLKVSTSARILQFFLDRVAPDLFVHFEMVPDRFPPALRELVAKFPPGMLQFEVGIQTFDDATATRIQRKHKKSAIDENLTFLRERTGVHVHSDLIVGLPGEDMQTFAKGFDHLVALRPQEIQVGILKRLRGTPISRHSREWEMVYSDVPPYEILANKLLSFSDLQRMKRFARAWDLLANSGNFRETLPLVWGTASPFWQFLALSDWLEQEVGAFKGIALGRLTELMYRYLVGQRGLDDSLVANALARDYTRPGREVPSFLLSKVTEIPRRGTLRPGIPRRQARHLA